MSGLTIDVLPNEMLIKILNFLDQETLSNATLTCKLWKNLIESSCPWSLVLRHNYRVGLDGQRIDFLLKTNRRFHTIKLNIDSISDKTIDVIRRHGVHVVRLCLIESRIDSFTKFAEVLKCLPNLKHVIIFGTSTISGEKDVQDLPELKKLKTLEMTASEYSIIKCFQPAKVTALKVLNQNYYYSLDCKALEDFLKTQDKLTSLAFRSIHHETSMLFRTENLSTPMAFQLTELSLLNIRLKESPNDYNNLLKFLKPQAKTLKALELGRNFPYFVYEFVFATMTNLKTLSLMMSEIPTDRGFYKRLEENRSINNLIFVDSERYNKKTSKFFGQFLKKLPKIHSLTVQKYCCNETFLTMAECLSELKTLVAYCFNEDIINGVQFPKLNSLYIQRIGQIDWNRFTKANSRLTELTIKEIVGAKFLTNDDIENITTNIRLQALRIGEHFTADKSFFEIIRKKCPDLKILDLAKSCVSNDLKDQLNWDVLRLCDSNAIECPKYFKLWNEDDYDGKFPYDVENYWDIVEGLIDPFELQLLHEDFDNMWDRDDRYDRYDREDDSDSYYYDRNSDGYDVDEDSDYGRRCAD